MTTMREIAQTMTTDFVAAVAATERAQVAALDDVTAKLDEARKRREETMAAVQRKREQAADIVAQSLREEEKCNGEFQAALNAISDDLSSMRGAKPLGTNSIAQLAA